MFAKFLEFDSKKEEDEAGSDPRHESSGPVKTFSHLSEHIDDLPSLSCMKSWETIFLGHLKRTYAKRRRVEAVNAADSSKRTNVWLEWFCRLLACRVTTFSSDRASSLVRLRTASPKLLTRR
jgi:hypothetical protein